MQFWPELTYKLYANSNVNCMRNFWDPYPPLFFISGGAVNV